MTDDTTPLNVEPEKATQGKQNEYFDGNESELDDETDEDIDEDATSLADDADDDDQSEDDQGDDGEENGDDEGEATLTEAEFADVEYEGKTYKVPNELKDALLRQSDYTRKTQVLGQERKAIEAERAQVQQLAQVTEQEIGLHADLRGIDSTLEAYKNVNWDALEAEDPLGAQQHWRRYQTLQNSRGETVQKLQQAQHQRTEQAEQMTARRLQETAAHAQKTIPNWSTELDAKITEFAIKKGFSRETLVQAYTPEVYETLYLAYFADQFIKKQAAAKPKSSAPAEKKPLSRISANKAPAGKKSLEEMDIHEYAAEMNRRDKIKAKR